MKTKGPIEFDISVSATKSKLSKGKRARPSGQRSQVKCQHPGCNNKGEYRAPSVPGKSEEIKWLCRAHAGQYNSEWNWFRNIPDKDAGANESEHHVNDRAVRRLRIYSRRKSGQVINRRLTSVEMRALRVLNLSQECTIDDIRKEYRSLVKDLHPDNNGGDRSDEGRLEEVVNAWNLLRNSRNFVNRPGR